MSLILQHKLQSPKLLLLHPSTCKAVGLLVLKRLMGSVDELIQLCCYSPIRLLGVVRFDFCRCLRVGDVVDGSRGEGLHVTDNIFILVASLMSPADVGNNALSHFSYFIRGWAALKGCQALGEEPITSSWIAIFWSY